MPLFKAHARPSPADWYKLQHAPGQLPHHVEWPHDVCSRCKVQGEMFFSSGKAQCADCEANTVIQVAPAVGLHERRASLELGV